jgi:hypothetical protein
VKSARISGNSGSGPESDRDLLAALTGTEASHERAVAHRTRRVVAASLGVMQDQKQGLRRSRSLALASILLVILAMGPFVWHVTDDLIGGEHWSDMATQTSLWVCILLPAVLAAALVAGWLRRDS